MDLLKALIDDEGGATAVEYGLIAALVSVAIITIPQTLRDNLNATFEAVAGGLETACDQAGE